jgi:Inheritance of peroxisomes protein 1
VDDASTKFVLQMRRPQYWRIEIPNSDPIDLRVLAEFKRTLSQILQFEKFACPFRRSFTIELPEIPANPVKRPWKPLKSSTQIDVAGCRQPSAETDPEEMYFSAASNDDQKTESESGDTDDTDLTPRNPLPRSTYQHVLAEDDSDSKVVDRTPCSVAAPSQLTLFTSPSLKTSRSKSPPRRSMTPDSRSSDFSSSVDSFHTVESWHSPISPLPLSPPNSIPASPTTYPYPHNNISLSKPPYKRDASEITVTPETPRVWEITRRFRTESKTAEAEECSTPPPRTPTLIDDIEDNLDEERFEIVTPPISTGRIRRRVAPSNSRRRALNTLPSHIPANNMSSPLRQHPRRLRTTRHLPTAIIQKTCEILLSPPSYLVHLMLDIASKITAGEWRGMIFGFGERGEKIVGQWDYGDGDVEEDEWGEDDYGICLGGNQATMKKSNTTVGTVGGSWEID